eukprot:TRINITY_DN48983_c0_g1_i1.p1 TRINITY_DN48983_c0_g1~~TRINITY_DN48983_c0_g1_i1.p1  ORF type:complete len:306 (+),score=59.75 TRINITY_DN48983_c0_g1_i1:83-919(+)
MDVAQTLASLESGDNFDASLARSALNAWCADRRLECSQPFLVDWYNQARLDVADGQNLIEAPGNSIAFALYSVPGFLKVVVEHFARKRPARGFVDAATNELLEELRSLLPAQLEALVLNTDEGPPYYHVQTVGAVAAVDQHLEATDVPDAEWREDVAEQLAETRDPKMWGTDPEVLRKIFGVNVHPVYGGWYAYRALVILRGARANLPRPEPCRFLEEADAKRILEEYNLRHELCVWRDLREGQDPQPRYEPEEYLFFVETSVAKRRRFLELAAFNVA